MLGYPKSQPWVPSSYCTFPSLMIPVIYFAHPKVATITPCLMKELHNLHLRLSIHKFVSVLFSFRPFHPQAATLSILQGVQIPFNSSPRYLRVTYFVSSHQRCWSHVPLTGLVLYQMGWEPRNFVRFANPLSITEWTTAPFCSTQLLNLIIVNLMLFKTKPFVIF